MYLRRCCGGGDSLWNALRYLYTSCLLGCSMRTMSPYIPWIYALESDQCYMYYQASSDLNRLFEACQQLRAFEPVFHIFQG
jgi:hypothetical protein